VAVEEDTEVVEADMADMVVATETEAMEVIGAMVVEEIDMEVAVIGAMVAEEIDMEVAVIEDTVDVVVTEVQETEAHHIKKKEEGKKKKRGPCRQGLARSTNSRKDRKDNSFFFFLLFYPFSSFLSFLLLTTSYSRVSWFMNVHVEISGNKEN